MILTIILISIAIYLLSAFLTWNYFRIAYSKYGIWSNIKITGGDIVIVFIPALNTFIGVFGWVIANPYKEKDYNKFFNIKK